MKLNVGCSWPGGRYKLNEWINLDLVGNERINVQGSAVALPFETGSFDEIHCLHVLEHLTRDKYGTALREMHRVLKKGGFCYIEVPDFRKIVELLHGSFNNQAVEPIHIWTTSIYGKNERAGMAHYMGFYEGLLRKAMRHQGFIDVVRLTTPEEMKVVPTRYKTEPVLLVRGSK